MKCIFCKTDSGLSRSVEHIIPESIGNTDHVLPIGVVCDTCNAYFAIKVEKPLLDTPFIRNMCFRAKIKNKKGNPPSVTGIHLPSGKPLSVYPNMQGEGMSIGAPCEGNEKTTIESIMVSEKGTLLIPLPHEPDKHLLSRFIAKVSIEALALRLMDVNGWNKEIVDKQELDPLRNYARRGDGAFWPFNVRQIYPTDFVFSKDEGESYEILHEWTFLYSDEKELYFVLGLFGNEYVINMSGHDLAGYRKWLVEHDNRSILTEQHYAPTCGVYCVK